MEADGDPTALAHFGERRARYELLREEAEFALKRALEKHEIKVHSVTSRVKDAESFTRKISRKGYADPFSQMPDITGVRVVSLFLSDLIRIEDVIRSTFHVETREDKINGLDDSSFGYMSQHFECTLGDRYHGARYDGIKELKFEVQSRTVVMDAWANISHHLSYKGEASIPAHLRRDFNALSGLFYVADQHFELFFRESRESTAAAIEQIREAPDKDRPVDLDTLQAYLTIRYPDRQPDERDKISELVEELHAAGYDTIDKLSDILDRCDGAAESFDQDRTAHADTGRSTKKSRFTRVGIVRTGLLIADRNYRESRRTGTLVYSKYGRYEHLVVNVKQSA